MRFVTTIGLIAFCSSFVANQAGDRPGSCLAAIETLENDVVLGVVGFSGQPTPQRWLILSRSDGGGLTEIAWSGGKVVDERSIDRLPGQDLPDIPIDFDKVRVDSDEAFRIAWELAERNQVRFAAVHFHLRCRDRGNEPVWFLKLLGAAQDSRGVVYLSAITGDVLRAGWTVREIEEFASASPIFTRRDP